MATNTNLGGVFTTDMENMSTSNVYLSTENIVGLIFDTAIVGGLAAALGTGTKAAETFAAGNVVELNVPKDVTEAGIDESVMCGLVKYHLDSFFSLAGANQRLFLSFMDSSTDTEFEAVEKMQLAANGIIYQIGVWTGKAIATKNGTDYSVDAGNVVAKLQTQAEVLGGKVGVTNYEGNAPINVILNAPIINEAVTDITKLPDLSGLKCPKVSVILGQAPTDAVHKIMFDINHVTAAPSYAVVGNVGAALGCLAVAPANESIGHVQNFNLATIMQEAELGFGNIKETGDDPVAYEPDSSFTNIKTLGYTKRNNYLHKNGYIFTTTYDGLENSIFFSCDQTCDTGDYRTISRGRVMHKSRRVVRRALLPYVNSNVEVDISTGYLSASTVAKFQNIVLSALDANMVEPGTTVPQISGRTCVIDTDQDVLNTDKIDINYSLIPLGTVSVINVTEGFVSSAS